MGTLHVNSLALGNIAGCLLLGKMLDVQAKLATGKINRCPIQHNRTATFLPVQVRAKAYIHTAQRKQPKDWKRK